MKKTCLYTYSTIVNLQTLKGHMQTKVPNLNMHFFYRFLYRNLNRKFHAKCHRIYPSDSKLLVLLNCMSHSLIKNGYEYFSWKQKMSQLGTTSNSNLRWTSNAHIYTNTSNDKHTELYPVTLSQFFCFLLQVIRRIIWEVPGFEPWPAQIRWWFLIHEVIHGFPIWLGLPNL